MNQDVEVHQTKHEPAVVFKAQVLKTEHEFRAALPAHIPVERFTRVVMTACVNNPALLDADRRSLFESAMQAAQDGLLPDNREGALVIYNTKVKGKNGDHWIKKVQWMPMIAGVLKKIRNSGELLSISAYIAYSNDAFEYELGDDEKIKHRPALEDRGKPRLVYAIAKTKDGGVYREIMTVADVEKVRAVSRAKDDGPWSSWWDEMARKTVLRRLSKRLPMSSDLDDLMRRDDSLYDFDGGETAKRPRIKALETTAERLKTDLDALAAGGNGGEPQPPHDPETGEINAGAIVDGFDQFHGGTEKPNMQNDQTGEKAGAKLAGRLAERATTGPQQDFKGSDGGPLPSEQAALGLQRLLDDARAKTKEGSQNFKFWVGKLNVKHLGMIEPYLGELRAEAKAADVGAGA